MSLIWDVSKVKDYEKNFPTTPDGKWNVITNLIASLCTTTKMDGIRTEKDAGEMYVRLRLLEICYGGGFIALPNGEHRSITYQECLDHVGMTVNVLKESRAKFQRNLFDMIVRHEIEPEIKKAKK